MVECKSSATESISLYHLDRSLVGSHSYLIKRRGYSHSPLYLQGTSNLLENEFPQRLKGIQRNVGSLVVETFARHAKDLLHNVGNDLVAETANAMRLTPQMS